MKEKWYNDASIITNIIMIVIGLIIVFSQSFVLNNNGSIELFTSIINHNSIYLFTLIYFILIKLKAGKRYFNYLSVFIIFIYFITTITSCLTCIQVFSLIALLDFILNLTVLIYLVHTLLRDTRVWREFYLSNSPFNELSNNFLFYSIVIISLILLAFNLINTIVLRGVILSVLDTIYIILLGRYIYLYRDYLDKKKINANNSGSFDVIRNKVQEVLDKTDIDEKIVAAKDKVVDTTKDIGKNIDNFVKEKEIDKKIDNAKDKVVDATKEIGRNISDTTKEVGKSIDKTINKKKTTSKKKTISTKKGE